MAWILSVYVSTGITGLIYAVTDDQSSQALNCHPKASSPIKSRNQSVGSFRIGVSEDKNKRCRRTMEDAHSFVYDFAGVKGQGYFAVFE